MYINTQMRAVKMTVVSSDWTRGNGHKLKKITFNLKTRKHFLL